MCCGTRPGRSSAGIVLLPSIFGHDNSIRKSIGGGMCRFPKQWCHFFVQQCQKYRKNKGTEIKMTPVSCTSPSPAPGSTVPGDKGVGPGAFPMHVGRSLAVGCPSFTVLADVKCRRAGVSPDRETGSPFSSCPSSKKNQYTSSCEPISIKTACERPSSIKSNTSRCS